MYSVKFPFAIVAVFVWIGFILAISFMEAWLKFKAPGISIKLGLGIGKLVFFALNKIEWLLAIVIGLNLILKKTSLFTVNNALFYSTLFLLVLQSIWLLPALDARAVKIINDINIPKTYLHFYYVAIEVVKLVCLFLFGLNLLKAK